MITGSGVAIPIDITGSVDSVNVPFLSTRREPIGSFTLYCNVTKNSEHSKLNGKVRRRLLSQNCGSLNDDDAIDPRTWFKSSRSGKHNHKAQQICRQVAETLQFVLSDADENREGEPLLENLQLIAVVPAPDSRRLLVTVGLVISEPVSAPVSAKTVEAILATLKLHTPRLRAEIARTVTRKKVPNLVFEFSSRP